MKEHFDPNNDGFGFIIETESVTEATCNVKVYQVTARTSDGGGGILPVDIAEDTEQYMTAYMKWDGCFHFSFKFGDEEGYYHLCGVSDLQLHCALIKRLHAKAYELMGIQPQHGQSWV